jgi:perosamine synthetase
VNSDLIIEFVRDTFKSKDFIPLHAPFFGSNEKKYLAECIDSTYVSSVGSFVSEIENELKNKLHCNHAVAVVNGTAALQVALQLSGVKRGTEVLTQALTFVATANSISYLGAIPVFIDVELDTMGLSPNSLLHFLEEFGELRENGLYNKLSGREITACLPMHTFGFSARIEEIVRICSEWNIPVIEDSAEALGSLSRNQHLGTFGSCGVFSFNGNKIVTAGGGGALVTNQDDLGIRAKHLTTTSKVPHPYEFVHDEIGYNYRMPNLNAALLKAQFEQLDWMLSKKRELAMKYNAFFANSEIELKWEMPGTKANFWLNTIQLESKEYRDLFLEETNKKNVMTRPVWQLMFQLSMYKECQKDNQQNAQFLADRLINLPSSIHQ